MSTDNNGPPPGVDEFALWQMITTLPRPHKLVPYPRKLPGTEEPVCELAIWPLTQEEQMAANAEADRFTKALLKDPQKKDEANLGYHHTFTNELSVQMLYRACRKKDDVKRPFFPSPKAMRAHMSTDEVGVLFNNYCTVQQEVGPIVAYMSAEEREAWILRLQEGGSAFPFDYLSWDTQRTLVLSMASLLVSYWTDMCSRGSPPDVSAPTLDLLKARMSSQSGSPETEEAPPDTDSEPAPPQEP